jgi:hypothetical protein
MEGAEATTRKAHDLNRPMLIYAFSVVTMVLGKAPIF